MRGVAGPQADGNRHRQGLVPYYADSEQFPGIPSLGFKAVALCYETDEAKEVEHAFRQKRRPKLR